MTARYESPEVTIILSEEEIRKRYQDAAMVIFKEQSRKKEVINYLSFGDSRRTMEYSSNGNHPVIIRKPAGSVITRNNRLSMQMLKGYHKPGESCAIT